MANFPSKTILAACLCAAPVFSANLLFKSDPARLPENVWQGGAASYLLAPAPYDSVLGNRIMASQGMLQDTTLRQMREWQRKMARKYKPSNPNPNVRVPVDSQMVPLEPGAVLFRTSKATFMFIPRTSEYVYSRPDLLTVGKASKPEPNLVLADSMLKAKAESQLKSLLGPRASQYMYSNTDSEYYKRFEKGKETDSGRGISVGRYYRYLLLKDNRAILSNSAHARLGLAMDGRVAFFSVLTPSLSTLDSKRIRGDWKTAVEELDAYARSRDKVGGPDGVPVKLLTVSPENFQPSLVLIKDKKRWNGKKTANPYADMRLAPAMTILCRNRTGNNSDYMGFIHISQETGKWARDVP